MARPFQHFRDHPSLAEIRLAQVVLMRFKVDIFDGDTTTAERRTRLRDLLSINGRAQIMATRGQTFGVLFRGIYGENV